MNNYPLIEGLSLEDKASLISGFAFWNTTAIETSGIPSVVLSDGPHGVRRQEQGADHLGINAARPSTAFPTASASASSWDRDLLGTMGVALGVEARALGVDVLLGPGVNIKRSPLCGRNFEYFSEDPLLSGELGAAWVRGLKSQGVGASVKHYVANDQETDRMSISAEVDERTLREIYLKAFHRVVAKSSPATVMVAYNAVNGEPVISNHWLLTQILREEWAYDGVVVSDWGAAASDVVAAVRAGLDLDMPGTGAGSAALIDAVTSGTLDEAILDRAASRVVELATTLVGNRAHASDLDVDAHHALARKIAEQSGVLLKNEGVLPLTAETAGTIAVVGEFARTPRYQGAGSSHIVPTRLDSALDAIRERAGDRLVHFEPGFTLDGKHNVELVDRAVAAAHDATDVVVFLGLPPEDESEAFDRVTMDLPADQLALLQRIASVNDRVTVVLSNGGVVSVEPWRGSVAAILEMWLGGQAAGSAAASLLFGDANPSGKLAETIPLALADTSSFHNFPGNGQTVLYGERIYVGYRHFDSVRHDVAYPFGHGLSYTSFKYQDLRVDVIEDALEVQVTITNSGPRDGAEIVQFYSVPPKSGEDRPTHELIGFEKVTVQTGASVRVTTRIPLGDLDYWSIKSRQWVRADGVYTIQVAASSRDIRLEAGIELVGTEPARPLTLDSAMGDWFADADGAVALQEMMAQFATRGSGEWDDATRPLVLPMPLRTILPMAASKLPFPVLGERLLQRLSELRADPIGRS
ncbi:glycoside hydrolase family 3 C-terminal domain-containing protein [Arthrobacter sp. Rue61a]|uniref:beta-glucosidase family protein n=1 Tax=Arthrobacter sp. Rue61a TaxID=1118963 RepID=UPI00027DFDB0|nr:glycoside hydrolase family 3 C-terminal domain-containing protein [Arthrobacter sp. Rue61a]AFR28776.1 thermostable beta-glucosidase B [Arthrobacter sp. Rue61a]